MKRAALQFLFSGPARCRLKRFGRPGICLCALLLAAVLLGSSRAAAQNGDAIISTNEVQQTDDSGSADLAQTADGLGSDDTVSTNSVAETNTLPVVGPDGRTRRLQRQRRPRASRDSSANGSTVSGVAGTNGTRNSLEYSAFRLVAERNIFDPNRAPRSSRAPVQQKTVDSFSLVGTMSYEKGDFAFFDGSSSDYRKVLKSNDVIAGYKIVAISPEQVTISSGTNQLELKVGTQMRRAEDGHWERGAAPAVYTASSSNTTSSQAPAGGAESDILKKMMMRREKE